MSEEIHPNTIAQGKAFPWHELYTPDVTASIEFYTKALGLETEAMEMGEMGTYHMLKHGGAAVAGVVDTNQPHTAGTPPHWAVYMRVESVDESLAKVEEFGGKVLAPAMDIPTVGRMALIMDPQGAAIWLFTPQG
jgi:predicted enzyme related to lactoylglutathione lyase